MEPFGKISSGNQPQTVETELKQISQFQREAKKLSQNSGLDSIKLILETLEGF